LRVLLVDDQPQILLIASIALEFDGSIEVLTADGAVKGIELARAQRPDLIVLDVMMPNVDGITACQRLKKDPELGATPIVFMTARVREEDIATYFAEGAVGVIPKPFNPRTLGDELKAFLAKSRES
jgi:two-component system OmpR family response regulator